MNAITFWFVTGLIIGRIVTSLFWCLIIALTDNKPQIVNHQKPDWWMKGEKPLGDAW